ncbi:glycosyltransferase family 2 protein [Candidatus Microgenomates bacterium]|nr:MAG: glycosyltransferase family 2 protein [Candidatus Microgenomates bacterium]
MSISIIIPNYNGENLLKKNLPKVFEAAKFYKEKENANIEIIVIDDASTDSSESIISSFQLLSSRTTSNFKFIQNKKNFGFSPTVNKGVKEAQGEILVLLNTDISPEKNFLVPLLSHFKDPSIFAVGCMDKSVENKKIVLRGRGIGKWQRGFLVHTKGEVDKTTTLWVNGGSGAFRKSIWQKIGGFNELYAPFYWEDIDLSYRALKSGYKILFEPKSTVLHEHERGAINIKYSPEEIKTIAYRNQFIFVWVNASDFNLRILHVLWLPYHFIKALTRRDLSFFIAFFKALILIPEIIQSNFKTQKLFLKKDREVVLE